MLSKQHWRHPQSASEPWPFRSPLSIHYYYYYFYSIRRHLISQFCIHSVFVFPSSPVPLQFTVIVALSVPADIVNFTMILLQWRNEEETHVRCWFFLDIFVEMISLLLVNFPFQFLSISINCSFLNLNPSQQLESHCNTHSTFSVLNYR